VPIDPSAFREFEHHGWETSVSAYDTLFGPLTKLTIGPLLDGVGLGEGMKLLDVATGPGYVAIAAKRRGASVIGVDFSEKMISKAQQVADNGISFRLADAEALPFEPESFDAVVMNFGVLHLGQPEKAFAEAFRVLKSGGSFGFTVWAVPEEAQGFAIILRAIEISGNPNAPLPAGPPFFRFSEAAECEVSLEGTGFKDVTVLKLPLTWILNSPDELFAAFYEGTARTGGLLRAQSREDLTAITETVQKSAVKFERGGKLYIPMPAHVVTARKA
jgi:SAM-dependent methyltransferase